MQNVEAEIKKKLRGVKLLMLDVDGVLTDGSIIYNDEGVEQKVFNVRDGHGIKLLGRGGIQCGVMTARSSRVLLKRCEDLGIELIYQGVLNKLDAFEDVLKVTGLDPDEIAYVGDDLIDIPVLRKVGFSATVSDGVEEVKGVVDYVAAASGGHGAVREVAELILKSTGAWEDVVRPYYEG